MPDRNNKFRGIAVPSEGWLKAFGPLTSDPDEVELDQEEPEFDIVWTPDPSLDGAYFVPESS